MPSDRRRFLRNATTAGMGWWLSSPSGAQDLSADGQPVVCRVIDRESGNKITARVRLLDANGNELVPLGHPNG